MINQGFQARFLGFLLAFGLLPAFAQPTIYHDPVRAIPSGESVGIIASVESAQPLSQVSMHVTTSSDAIPHRIAMTPRGAGAYFGTIPAALTRNTEIIRYYIEARTATDFSETPFHSVQVGNFVEESAPVSAPIQTPPPVIRPTESYPPAQTYPPARTYPTESYPPAQTYPTQPAPPPVQTYPQPAPPIQTAPPPVQNAPPPYTPPEPPPEPKQPKNWKVPALIAAGAIAIGVAIWGASSGGDDSGDDGGDPAPPSQSPPQTQEPSNPTPTNPTPTNPGTTTPDENEPGGSREVITQAANDSVNSAIVDFPVQTTVDATPRFLGRNLVSTSISLSYNPEDNRAERFQVLFDNNVVLDTGDVTSSGNVNVVVPAGTGIVTISVPSSVRDNTLTHNWSWAASIAYVVE